MYYIRMVADPDKKWETCWYYIFSAMKNQIQINIKCFVAVMEALVKKWDSQV